MFKRMRDILRALLRRDDGPTSAEYGVMLALIALATLVAFTTFADRVTTLVAALPDAIPAG